MPLSKLFHKLNSLKDKKGSSNTGSCTNEASTSAKCDIKSVETENKDSSSTGKLCPTIETVKGASCDFKEKEPTLVEQQPSSTTETVKDSLCQSQCNEVRHEGSTEQLSSKSENVLDMSSECKGKEIPIGNSTSTEHLLLKTEIIIEAPSGMKNEQVCIVDSSTEQVISTAANTTNVPCDFMSEDINNVNSTSIEKLSPITETIIDGHCDNENSGNIASISSEQSYQTTETTKDISCDSKDEVNVGSSNTEELSLKTKNEKNPDIITHEVTQGETRQLPEYVQEQNDYEPVLNSKETGSAIGTSVHPNNNGSSSAYCKLGHSNENVDIEKSSYTKNKTRSSSFEEAGSKPAPAHSKTRRRKCESESSAFNSTDDEGFEDRVLLQFREKDLEEVIGRCVNRLIRESIAMAVRNADVEGLYDEVIKTISDRSQLESSVTDTGECSGTVEQKLHTDSVKEYADLEMLETFEDSLELQEIPVANSEYKIADEDSEEVQPRSEIANEDDCAGENMDGFNGSRSMSENAIEVSEDKEIDLDGYRADLEESTSLHSLTKTTNVCMSNIENETGNEEHTKSTSSDVCPAGMKEPNAHATNKKNTNGETVNADENQSPSDDSKYNEGNFMEDTERSSPKAEGTEILDSSSNRDPGEVSKKNVGMLRVESEDLISMSDESVSELLSALDHTKVEEEQHPDLGMNLPQQNPPAEEGKKVNWKVGYLHVKLPPKARGKGHLKAWKKRCVAVHPDEFANDPKDPWLMISVYSGESGHARKHSASFWKSVSCRKAVVYRSSSSSRRYAFTIADDGKPVVHLAADSEALSQEWMAAVRSVLWPPSPVVQLEKMLNGSQFEVSLIDNEFSYRAGLLGMYGHLTITPKKLILVHPQQGYVIQEWYLNTVDRFELMQQTRIEDVHKVLSMTTCSDSSTGKGEILIFCREAVTLLQSLASTIHQILTYHSKQEGGKYRKELEEMAEWLNPSTPSNAEVAEEYYKVPPRQVRSLLDIPNFIFDKPLNPVSSVASASGIAMYAQKSPQLAEVSKTNPSRASQDSGISAGASSDDFLNCSVTSFVVGGGNFPPGKSSDSELSDSYTPPVSPPVKAKHEEEKKTQVNAS